MISTHTLTWSVTKDFLRYATGKIISTHTLTWSVTLQLVLITRPQAHFNSHAHVERDTHFTALALYYTNFNSHAHVERDLSALPLLALPLSFQLTRSRGA